MVNFSVLFTIRKIDFNISRTVRVLLLKIASTNITCFHLLYTVTQEKLYHSKDINQARFHEYTKISCMENNIASSDPELSLTLTLADI